MSKFSLQKKREIARLASHLEVPCQKNMQFNFKQLLKMAIITERQLLKT